MKFITVLLIVVFLFMYIIPKFNLKFTNNLFKGFSSFNEFLHYFRFAYNFTLKNKFVYLFPFIFVISINLIYTITFYIARINYKNSVFDNKYSFNLINYLNFDSLINSIRQLDYGFYDYVYIVEIGTSILILLFGLIYFLLYRKTNKSTGNGYEKIYKSFKFYLIFLFINVIIFLFLHFVNIALPNVLTTILSISILIFYSLEILFIILIQSAFEFIILVFLTIKLQKKELNIDSIKEYLVFIKPLFLLNTFLGFEYELRTGLWNIMTFVQFNNNLDAQLISNCINYIYQYLDYIYYIWILLFIFLFPSAFILIFNKFNFTSTIQHTLKFVLDNLVKYVLFIISGIMLMYISSLLSIIPANLVERLSHLQPIIMTLSACLKLFLAVIFYIAFFKFYIDSQPKANQNQIV